MRSCARAWRPIPVRGPLAFSSALYRSSVRRSISESPSALAIVCRGTFGPEPVAGRGAVLSTASRARYDRSSRAPAAEARSGGLQFGSERTAVSNSRASPSRISSSSLPSSASLADVTFSAWSDAVPLDPARPDAWREIPVRVRAKLKGYKTLEFVYRLDDQRPFFIFNEPSNRTG